MRDEAVTHPYRDYITVYTWTLPKDNDNIQQKKTPHITTITNNTPNRTRPPTPQTTDSHLNLLLKVGSARASERRVSAQQQVGDDPDAPHVARAGEVRAADNLGGHVHLRSVHDDRHSQVSIGSAWLGFDAVPCGVRVGSGFWDQSPLLSLDHGSVWEFKTPSKKKSR